MDNLLIAFTFMGACVGFLVGMIVGEVRGSRRTAKELGG
jgi:hypothetical protein